MSNGKLTPWIEFKDQMPTPGQKITFVNFGHSNSFSIETIHHGFALEPERMMDLIKDVKISAWMPRTEYLKYEIERCNLLLDMDREYDESATRNTDQAQ